VGADGFEAEGEVDGRTARRDRNRTAVLDAALDLFSEGNLTPSPEDVAQRSGVSLRSVYRYVASSDDLIRSAIERHTEKIAPLFVIEDIGQGAFERRLEVFVDTRLRVYDAIAATSRASRVRAPTNDIIRAGLERGRQLLGAQLERQFATELEGVQPEARRAVLVAADALTQIETIDLYRHHRGFSSRETREMLMTALRALLLRTY
jgi:TetR/AcrR family transcriptional regulator, regulator of autoinduction and epiphytic fitness